MRAAALLILAATAACSGPAPQPTATDGATSAGMAAPAPRITATPAAAGPAAMTHADYLGRWIGVEGLNLEVTALPQGGVMLDMQYDLDNRGRFPGSVTAEGLRFTRNGVAEIAVPSDGDATGLKWLAGKTDCLTVKPGEGYCRA